jgi:hypothetical protein
MTLAEPTASVATRRWRTTLLDRWRSGTPEDRAFVLDVYECTIVHHLAAARAQIARARAILAEAVGANAHRDIEDAISIAEWWGPLWALDRSHGALLRERAYLDYSYRQGLQLFAAVRRGTKR